MIANNRGIESARTGAKADSQNLRPSFTAILDQRIRIKPNNLLSFFFYYLALRDGTSIFFEQISKL